MAGVFVDLRLNGGDLFELTKDLDSWNGVFVIPNTVVPGNLVIPLLLEDSDGAQTIVDGPSLLITNDGPILSNAQMSPEKIIAPKLGEMSEEFYTIVVSAEDSDGINAVQIKFHELLPADEGETWKLMFDDGTNGDLNAGDGIYTISFQARHIPAGFVEIELRGVDVYGQVTILKNNIIIESEYTNIG